MIVQQNLPTKVVCLNKCLCYFISRLFSNPQQTGANPEDVPTSNPDEVRLGVVVVGYHHN